MAKQARHAMLEQLVVDGVKHVFGNPGTTEEGFMDALNDFPQLQYILSLHEGVAVSIADAYARVTQKPAFIQLHTAAGLGNGIGMLSKAQRHYRPLVIYAGNADSRGLLAEPTLGGDLVALAKPISKWAVEANHADEVPLLVRRALKIAAEPPQGPVFISVPMDVMEETTGAPVVPTTFTDWRSRPPLAQVQEAVDLLAAARRPIIVAGDGVTLCDAHSQVGAIAELIGAPIYSGGLETNAPADHPLDAGEYAPARNQDADLVLMLGSLEEAPLVPVSVAPVAPGARVIQVHPNFWELAKTYNPDLTINADIKATLADVIPALRARLSPEQVAAARQRASQVTERRAAELQRARDEADRRRDATPISDTRMYEELGRAVPADAAVFGRFREPFMKPRPGLYFGGGGGGIGSVLPGAVGLQLAMPERPVIGIDGDGSALFSTVVFWTAAHHNIPAKFVVWANQAYRILKVNLLSHMGEAAHGREFQAMDLTNPVVDWVKMAESQGVRGWRVDRPGDLGDAFRTAFAHPGPALVEVVGDGSIPGRD